MSRKKKLEDELEQFQIDFIRGKVKELGSYAAVCGFYSKKDLVGAFAKQEAAKLYDVTEDHSEIDVAPAPKITVSKEPKKMETRKRKRKLAEVAEEE